MSTSGSTTTAPVQEAAQPTLPRTDGTSRPESGPTPLAHAGKGPKATPRRWVWGIAGALMLALLIASTPWIVRSMNTVSTDDAFVNGHVTFVAPRVAGQVAAVLVDDNNRVRKGDLLVQLDKEPFEVQVNIAEAAVTAARAELVTAEAQARSTEGQMRSLRFNLERSIEDVNNQIAALRAKVATLHVQKATLVRAQGDLERAKQLFDRRAVSKEELDLRNEAFLVAEARVEEALQGVFQARVSLGLPPTPEGSDDLAQVPEDIEQTFSSVRQAQARLIQAAAQLGVTDSFNKTPKQMVVDFYKRDPQGDIDRIYAKLLEEAPSIKQAQSKLVEAERKLDQTRLNLRYCDVVAEIDGVVTRRNVNPGNNVIAGQSVLALRSLTEIWVDANFKETQLRKLRIGQGVDLDVDMYGRHKRFQGRISGFTMGTGSTLALLPAENATGNFVKVVQRLPVRIEILDYDADQAPLFIGLSVTPSVRVNELPTGPDAGNVLQPYLPATSARPAAPPADAGGSPRSEAKP
jgi:membrane fusion protein (multidrug efflux system)